MCLFRWIIFRIMVGAGMIKIRGDNCWRDLTCMYWFHETQPIPNAIAYFMHNSPKMFLMAETLVNHFVELVVPWFMLMPSVYCVRFAGVVQIGFMIAIYVSGNLSFLNVLTMVPSLACLDDGFFEMMKNKLNFRKNRQQKYQKIDSKSIDTPNNLQSYIYSNLPSSYLQKTSDLLILSTIAYLSIPVVRNLFSRAQIMNTNFDTFKIVNTYGAFGSVTKERYEIIIYGTTAEKLDGSENWIEYEFNCKPGKVDQIPCQVAPYHYRLDWLMWFAAFGNQSWRSHTWFLSLVLKMLRNDRVLLEGLMWKVPAGEVKFVKARRFVYNFGEGDWWKREEATWEDMYLPVMDLKGIERLLGQYPIFEHWLQAENH